MMNEEKPFGLTVFEFQAGRVSARADAPVAPPHPIDAAPGLKPLLFLHPASGMLP
jgi:hypothetical protein